MNMYVYETRVANRGIKNSFDKAIEIINMQGFVAKAFQNSDRQFIRQYNGTAKEFMRFYSTSIIENGDDDYTIQEYTLEDVGNIIWSVF